MAEVKLVIDGEEVILAQNGNSRRGTYEKYREPEEYRAQGIGEAPLIATIYLKPGWKPSQGK